MAKYRSPGKRSSSSSDSAASGLLLLKKIAKSAKIKKISEALGKESKLVIVGGILREILSGKKNADTDLATVYPPEKVRALLKKSRIRTYETGLQHGTITAVVAKENIEITTFRKPVAGKKNVFSKWFSEDLSARDFTINAIAYDPFSNKLIDPLKGASDLKKGLLKACKNPDRRFKEDPQRIIRMIRCGPAAGRKIDPKTLKADIRHGERIKKVSGERIGE